MLSSETNTVLHGDGQPDASFLSQPIEAPAERHDPDLGDALIFMVLAILVYWLVPIFLLMVILPDGSA